MNEFEKGHSIIAKRMFQGILNFQLKYKEKNHAESFFFSLLPNIHGAILYRGAVLISLASKKPITINRKRLWTNQ
jgi:hypothetical protein